MEHTYIVVSLVFRTVKINLFAFIPKFFLCIQCHGEGDSGPKCNAV